MTIDTKINKGFKVQLYGLFWVNSLMCIVYSGYRFSLTPCCPLPETLLLGLNTRRWDRLLKHWITVLCCQQKYDTKSIMMASDRKDRKLSDSLETLTTKDACVKCVGIHIVHKACFSQSWIKTDWSWRCFLQSYAQWFCPTMCFSKMAMSTLCGVMGVIRSDQENTTTGEVEQTKLSKSMLKCMSTVWKLHYAVLICFNLGFSGSAEQSTMKG